MKRLEKKKLVLTKVDVRTLVLTRLQLGQVAGASGAAGPCPGITPTCTDKK
jgi:hypothetical protein